MLPRVACHSLPAHRFQAPHGSPQLLDHPLACAFGTPIAAPASFQPRLHALTHAINPNWVPLPPFSCPFCFESPLTTLHVTMVR